MKRIYFYSGFPITVTQAPKDKWVAFSKEGIIVAIGDSIEETIALSRQKGENTPIISGDASEPFL